MTKWNYLKSIIKSEPKEVYDTWQSLGSIKLNSNTKYYAANTFFKVEVETQPDEIPCDLGGALVYCVNSYQVVPNKFPEINWKDMTVEKISQMVMSQNGIISPFFKVIALPKEIESVEGSELAEGFIPYSKMPSSSTVTISDDDLIVLLTECGVPFLRLDELEYDRETILQYMIKPALTDFYTYFPIIEEENLGPIGAGVDFDFPLPENAHGAIPYYVLGTAGKGVAAGRGAGSPFAMYSEMMMWGGGIGTGGGFGGGISYRKPVPGFTGAAAGQLDAQLQGLQAAQGYTNYFRREKVRKYRNKEDGLLHIKGFSTVGGTLCVKWLCHSYDWDDIDFELLGTCRDHCKAVILRNLGMLNHLIKSDTPGAIDFSLYNTRADQLDEKSIEKWKVSPTNYRFAIMRGGL